MPKRARGQLWYRLNVVASKRAYLRKLRASIQDLHKCKAAHRYTVPVHEVFRRKTVWRVEVEVFDLTGHPKAVRCYAWGHLEGSLDLGLPFAAVLELPPVDTAQKAVLFQIVKAARETRSN